MHPRFVEFWRGKRSESGAAAIEFAYILPLVAVIYIGTIDLSSYISVNRKVSNASSILSDLITQNVSIISSATIDDAFEGAVLAMKPVAADTIGFEIRDYRMVNDELTQLWTRKYAAGLTCSAPDTSSLAGMMAANNDIIIATVCTEFEPAASKALGKRVLGGQKFTVESQVNLRPRESSTIDCIDC